MVPYVSSMGRLHSCQEGSSFIQVQRDFCLVPWAKRRR